MKDLMYRTLITQGTIPPNSRKNIRYCAIKLQSTIDKNEK